MSVATQSAATTTVPTGASTATAYSNASLYVGDLHPDVNETILFDTFAHIGPVTSVRICRDNATRRSLGYGYVNYQSLEDAERALQIMNHKEIKGKPCRIMWTQRDPTARRSGVGNIFVKNLPASFDSKRLHDAFSVFGNITSAKVAVDAKGASNGYGFVQFESDEIAAKAVEAMNNRNVEGKVLSVEPFRAQRDRGATARSLFTNVFVKNLPETWTKEDLEKYFSQFGTITSAMLSVDEEKKVSRCFGFLNYATMEQASAAIEKANGVELGEPAKKIYVGRAQKKDERARIIRERSEQSRAERYQKLANTNLYVKNLPEDVDDEKLRAFFSKFGTLTSVRVMIENGRSKGFGFAAFSSADEATKALTEGNGSTAFGKPLFISVHQPREQRRSILENQMRAAKMGQNPMQLMGMHNMFRNGNGMMFPPVRGPWPMNMGMNMGMMMPNGPMPYHLTPMGRPGPRGQNAGRGRQQGGLRQQGQPGQFVGQPRVPGARAPGATGARQPRPNAPAPTTIPNPNAPIDSSLLAQMEEKDAKQYIGERLYPLVQELRPEDAPKITGMLLEMDIVEVLTLLESRDDLVAKVTEAYNVLHS